MLRIQNKVRNSLFHSVEYVLINEMQSGKTVDCSIGIRSRLKVKGARRKVLCLQPQGNEVPGPPTTKRIPFPSFLFSLF